MEKENIYPECQDCPYVEIAGHCLECFFDHTCMMTITSSLILPVKYTLKQFKALAQSVTCLTPSILNSLQYEDCLLIGYSEGTNGKTGALIDAEGTLYICYGPQYRVLKWAYVRGQDKTLAEMFHNYKNLED